MGDANFSSIHPKINNLKISNVESVEFDGENLREEDIHALAELLKINSSIKHLVLKNVNLNDKSAKEIGIAIKSNTSIITLDLSHNAITFEGAKEIFKGLKVNQSIERFSLSNNQLNSKEISQKEVTIFLQFNKTLKELYLSKCNITDETFDSIFQGLSSSPLEKLDLHENNISGNDGMNSFINCM